MPTIRDNVDTTRRSRPRHRWHLLHLALAALTVLLLFILGAQPFAVGLFPAPWDKLAHFVCYAAIAILLAIGFDDCPAWLLVLIVSLIGALDEWHQMYLPTRSADLHDLLTDIVAAISAVAIYEISRAQKPTLAAVPEDCS